MSSYENDRPVNNVAEQHHDFNALALLKEGQPRHDAGMMNAVYHPDSDDRANLQEAHWRGGGYGGNGWGNAALGLGLLYLGSQMNRPYYAPPPVYYPPQVYTPPPVYVEPSPYYYNPNVGQRYYPRPYYPQQYQHRYYDRDDW